MNIKSFLAGTFVLLAAKTPAFAAEVNNSYLLELAIHRVERLTELKKLDETFDTKLAKLELSKTSPADVTGGVYTVTAVQSAGADQTQNRYAVVLNDQGKAIKDLISPMGTPAGEPTWGEVSPLLYFENAFHYILEHGAEHAEMKTFADGVTVAEISQLQVNGQIQAKITLSIPNNSQVLELTLDTQGNVISAQVK